MRKSDRQYLVSQRCGRPDRRAHLMSVQLPMLLAASASWTDREIADLQGIVEFAPVLSGV